MTFDLDTVIKFARRRHNIWRGKQVNDPILTQRKFTNVFRVLDRGSQYLLELMDTYQDPLNRVAVSYFYRQVNRPDTMDAIIEANNGYVPNFSEITDAAWYDRVVWPVAEERTGEFLSGAYMILIKPGGKASTVAKMQEVFPAAAPYLRKAAARTDLESRVRLLQKTPGLGPFMAMQIATDLGYCKWEPDQENTFILAGPGSRKGVKFISDRKAEDVIKNFPVNELPMLPGSGGRSASWMDVQNVFCEFSKWARLRQQGYTGIGKPYSRHEPFPVRIPKQFRRK
jgi:hypothetical protein